MRPIDTSRFQFGVVPDDDPEFDPEEERRAHRALSEDGANSVQK
jgi:hypothetical protein